MRSRRRFAKLGRLREIFASRILDRNYTPLISVKFYGNFCVHQLEMFFAGWVGGWRRVVYSSTAGYVWCGSLANLALLVLVVLSPQIHSPNWVTA